jgi:hypothetical protein
MKDRLFIENLTPPNLGLVVAARQTCRVRSGRLNRFGRARATYGLDEEKLGNANIHDFNPINKNSSNYRTPRKAASIPHHVVSISFSSMVNPNNTITIKQ